MELMLISKKVYNANKSKPLLPPNIKWKMREREGEQASSLKLPSTVTNKSGNLRNKQTSKWMAQRRQKHWNSGETQIRLRRVLRSSKFMLLKGTSKNPKSHGSHNVRSLASADLPAACKGAMGNFSRCPKEVSCYVPIFCRSKMSHI
jgi:hypothetical protein